MGKKASLADLNNSVTGLLAHNTNRHQCRVAEVVANPLNPRSAIGDVTELAASIEATGQLQPCTVVTAPAWLSQYPEHADHVGNAAYVAVAGARRLAAIARAGLPRVEIVVKDDLADSRESLAVAAIAENIDREDLNPLDEAEAVFQLQQVTQSQRKTAKLLNRGQPWVSKRLKLRQLAPPMRKLLKKRQMTIEDAVELAGLPVDEQEDAWLRSQTAPAAGDSGGITPPGDSAGITSPAGFGGEAVAARVRVGDRQASGDEGRPRPWRPEREVDKVVRAVRRIGARPESAQQRTGILALALRRTLTEQELGELSNALRGGVIESDGTEPAQRP